MALVSGGLFALVAISSIRAARRRLSYETWYGLHLYAYLAIALGFLHQLFVGADFIHDPIAVGYWVALYVVDRRAHPRLPDRPAGLAVRPSSAARVANIVDEAPGRHLDLPDRPRARPAGGPVRPVLRLAVPDPRRLVARPSVLDLVGPQRRLAADHDQGARRLVEGAPAGLGRDARLRRGSVRRPDRRPADAAQGPAHRRRDRHHAAARAARGTAGRARRPDPPVPRPRARPRSSSATSSRRSPVRAARGSTTSSARGGRRGRSARRAVARAPRPGHRRPRRLPVRPGPDDAAGRGDRSAASACRTSQIHAERFAY